MNQKLSSEKLLLRGSEVAQTLGISRALAYRWMASGVLPTLRRGRCIRVPAEALQEWVAASTRPSDVSGRACASGVR
ncbi:MAG: helix-turn-helix domain-containing protein [Bryobacteraceae bacterium]